MSVSKENILEKCKQVLSGKRTTLLAALSDLSDSMTSETKSSVGDKHETGRAKMQNEFEQLSHQLDELNEQQQALERINTHTTAESIFSGTVIETNNGIFFMATPIGKINVDGTIIYVISPQSPIGKLMMGLKTRDTFMINGTSYRIERYY